tara:strand:+ start:13068 stop:16016 length:2949 start_codon:yes stop_codon:yes gene_type:complete
MRIAFVGNHFHEKTGSSSFFKDILRELTSEVEFFNSDNTGIETDSDDVFESVVFGAFDLVVCWQSEHFAERLLGLGQRLLIVPMWDAAALRQREYWHRFRTATFISFCREQHEMLISAGCRSHYFQYYTNPEDYPDLSDKAELYQSAFFWERRPEEWWNALAVADLCNQYSLKHLHLHAVADYGESTEELDFPSVSRSDWFDQKSDFLNAKAEHGVCFVSRTLEGIGHSFLESLAMGQCVIAPNLPTANEYISDRINGIILSPWRTEPPTRAELQRYGKQAREACMEGWNAWQASVPELKRIIQRAATSDTSRIGAATGSDDVLLDGPEVLAKAPDADPVLSIVITIKNDRKGLRKTLQSIAEQGCSGGYEILIGDSCSDDDPRAVAEDFPDLPIRFATINDTGVYDGMNICIDLCDGEFIFFLNAADVFYSDTVLGKVLASLKQSDADLVVGGHIYLDKKTNTPFRRQAGHFDQIVAQLQEGALDHHWFSAIPSHQSTFTRRSAFDRYRYDLRYRIAADHDFLLRQVIEDGAKVEVMPELISIYEGGGFSSKNEHMCQSEWHQIYHSYTLQPSHIDDHFAPGSDYRIGTYNAQTPVLVCGGYPPEGPYPELGLFHRTRWVSTGGIEIAIPAHHQTASYLLRGNNLAADQYLNITFGDQTAEVTLSDRGFFCIRIELPASPMMERLTVIPAETASLGDEEGRQAGFGYYALAPVTLDYPPSGRLTARQIPARLHDENYALVTNVTFGHVYPSGNSGDVLPAPYRIRLVAERPVPDYPIYFKFRSVAKSVARIRHIPTGHELHCDLEAGESWGGLPAPARGWSKAEYFEITPVKGAGQIETPFRVCGLAQDISNLLTVEPNKYIGCEDFPSVLPAGWEPTSHPHITNDVGRSIIRFDCSDWPQDDVEIWFFMSIKTADGQHAEVQMTCGDGETVTHMVGPNPELYAARGPEHDGELIELELVWPERAKILLFGMEVKVPPDAD